MGIVRISYLVFCVLWVTKGEMRENTGFRTWNFLCERFFTKKPPKFEFFSQRVSSSHELDVLSWVFSNFSFPDNISGYDVICNFHGKWSSIKSSTLVKDTSSCVYYQSWRAPGENILYSVRYFLSNGCLQKIETTSRYIYFWNSFLTKTCIGLRKYLQFHWQ